VILVLAVFVIHVFFHRPTVESLLFAIALAVGLSPELLPAILTISSRVVRVTWQARGVIVRRLSAIESLAAWMCSARTRPGRSPKGVVRIEQAVDPQVARDAGSVARRWSSTRVSRPGLAIAGRGRFSRTCETRRVSTARLPEGG